MAGTAKSFHPSYICAGERPRDVRAKRPLKSPHCRLKNALSSGHALTATSTTYQQPHPINRTTTSTSQSNYTLSQHAPKLPTAQTSQDVRPLLFMRDALRHDQATPVSHKALTRGALRLWLSHTPTPLHQVLVCHPHQVQPPRSHHYHRQAQLLQQVSLRHPSL